VIEQFVQLKTSSSDVRQWRVGSGPTAPLLPAPGRLPHFRCSYPKAKPFLVRLERTAMLALAQSVGEWRMHHVGDQGISGHADRTSKARDWPWLCKKTQKTYKRWEWSFPRWTPVNRAKLWSRWFAFSNICDPP